MTKTVELLVVHGFAVLAGPHLAGVCLDLLAVFRVQPLDDRLQICGRGRLRPRGGL